MASFRAAVRRGLEAQPSMGRALARLARLAGAAPVAERVDRILAGPGFVEIAIPEHLGAVARTVRMSTCDGRDQVVAALQRGWTEFEHPMPDAFVALVAAQGGTVLDIGANTGFYSLAATATRDDVRAIAFEPFPPVIEVLRSNLAANHRGRRVEVEEVALGADPGTADLHIPDPSHGLVETSASLASGFKEATAGTVAVRVETVDRIIAAHPSWHPTVVKIDVESLEHAVLSGARDLLRRHRPSVFFEVLPIGEPEVIDDVRAAAGYTDVRLRPGGIVVGGQVRFDPDGWNHLMVPDERLEPTLAILAGIGLVPQESG